MEIGRSSVLKTIFLSILVIIIVFYLEICDKRTKIVFCDVGQGDAAYIRVKNRVDILIDTGPDRKVVSCLGKHMPFYDRKIELVVLSHPQKDHYGGLSYILSRYQVGRVATYNINSNQSSFLQLLKTLKQKKIDLIIVKAGSTIGILDTKLEFFWPMETLIPLDENSLSLGFLFQEDRFRSLFTGDASALSLNLIISRSTQSQLVKLKNVNILKVPHHGSKNGLTIEFLRLVNPQVGVVSAGKNNPYGHPAKEILEMLRKFNIKVRRTDKEGDIVYKIPN